jgi:coatomer subunit beta'
LAVNAYESVYFYDFESQVFIRKIEVSVNNVIWNENKKTIALVCEDVTYILKFNEKAVEEYLEKIENNDEEEELSLIHI